MSRIKPGSLKARYVKAFSTLALSLCLVYSCMTLLFSYVVEDALIYKLIIDEQNHLKKQLEQGKTEVNPRNDYLQLYWSLAQAPKVITTALEQDPQTDEVYVDQNTYYHIQQLDLGRFGQPYLIAEVSGLLVVSRLGWAMGIFMLLVLLGTLLVSVWLAFLVASRLTRPIEELTEQVKWLEHGDTQARLSAVKRDDEIGYLAQTLSSTFASLRESLKREENFTRDVSHELRTPVTILKNLMLTDPALKAHSTASQALGDLDSTLEILLALARAENFQAQPLSVAPVIEDILLQIVEIGGDVEDVEVKIPYDLKVVGNLNLFSILVKNLVQNALHHGQSLTIDYELETGHLVFANRYNHNLPSEPTRHGSKSAASEGFGHGLYLVERIIEVLGWQYQIVTRSAQFAFQLKPKPVV